MMHAEIERKRCRHAGARALLFVITGCVVLLAPARARADFDITNDWFVSGSVLPGPTFISCTWAFQQTGSNFTAGGSCGTDAYGGLQGTIDVVSGAVAGTGNIMNLLGGGLSFSFTGSVAP